jgi:uncharacterized membrane protein
MWTGLLGLLVAGPIGWIAGLGIGAGAGAITAKVVDIGIPDEWVDWFKEAVHPHTSTVIALATDVNLTAPVSRSPAICGAELVHTTLRPVRRPTCRGPRPAALRTPTSVNVDLRRRTR